ncbi:phosphate ABC transporter substrate-binding protein [Senegalimassilia faecalis]|uniref:Phosphate ABC transporter substrate-binding protein n=1 Tax=Senegalimassilia faecalis TaxID=2509433 RepID=A0A4Q2K1R4_9ACTN|nr:phosphate ABC transporter substrate-binding protein [Senegalimassilia faecalis]RXZ53504.1 phosphate ABC transporter substrate-binding protein [Senegalimassilia faecalis]
MAKQALKEKPLARGILAAVMAAALGCGLLAGCSSNNASTQPAGNKSASTEQASGEFQSNIMFCGSTSAYPIISSLAFSFTDQYETWNKVDASFPEKNISIYVAPGGSGVGVSALEEGTCDFGMVARTLKDSEKEKLGDYKEYEIAKDALTVSVNAENPIVGTVDDMSTDTIRKIFAGEITTWDQVDASLPAEQIQVYIRDLSGGAYEVFQKSVMGDSKVTDAATQSASMTELATNIANNKWAIGYAGFGAYNKANANGTKLVAMKVDGVEATEANIVSGDYKIQRPVMFVGVGEPTDSEQAFIDYIYSDAGIKAIESNGYIPSFTAK